MLGFGFGGLAGGVVLLHVGGQGADVVVQQGGCWLSELGDWVLLRGAGREVLRLLSRGH